jgi:L-serine dehydratase
MGKIVAAPTAGSAGVVPACLFALQEEKNYTDETMALSLFNTGAIGRIIAQNASIAGASGGCQAECGTAAAMAASAMVELSGGTPAQCADAVAHVIKSVLGLVCDPVAGLVEEPCAVRNVSCAVIAVSSAELALAGFKSIVPADEVIQVMDTIGRNLPETLRETSGGGLAQTPTGQAIAKSVHGT